MYKLSFILLALLNNEKKDSIDFIIAKYILENVDDLRHISIVELSQACHVSKSTISRFCRKIGLEDFSEIKHELYNVNFYRDSKFHFELNNGDDSYLLKVANQITKLHNYLDYNKINQLVKDIYKYPRVITVGHMQSQLAAFHLQEELFISRKITFCPSLYNLQLDYFKDCTKDDLIIVFSNEGGFFEKVFMRKLKINELKDPKIYFITSNNKVQYYDYTDEVILVPDNDDFISHPMQFNLVSNVIAQAYATYCRNTEEGNM